MLSKRALRVFLGLTLALSVSATVLAVRYGVADDDEHPYVGIMVFYDAANVPQWRCTGTLISPTVVLTAGHCAELNGPARVWFGERVADNVGYPFYASPGNGVTGRAFTYPQWRGGLYLPDTGDAGVVVLDEPMETDDGSYPSLAPVGYLDGLATARGTKDVNFEVVGYGLQEVRPRYSAIRDRLKAWVQLVNLRSALTDGYNLQTTNAQGKGTGGGGTCFGDSGGAIFNRLHQIVAVNSFVLNDYCAGSSFGYRVDKPAVQEWINSFLD